MGSVSFYCTRCRRLLTFPSSRRDSIVYCPYCQQTLIVPTIATDGEEDFDASSVAAPVASELEFAESGTDSNEPNAKRTATARKMDAAINDGVPIASHWGSARKRLDSIRRVPVSGVDAAPNESTLRRSEISDADFIDRLRADRTNSPRRAVEPPLPVGVKISNVPPPLSNVASAASNGVPKVVFILIGALGLGVLAVCGSLAFRSFGGADELAVPREVASEPIFVDGALTYRTADGRVEGDEGAFVFLFPVQPFAKPLTTGDATPYRDLPPAFSDVVSELEARGGYFAVAEFEGRFSISLKKPGEYNVLLISRNVAANAANADPQALKEIARYLYLPEKRILQRNQFFWTRKRLDSGSAVVEKDFGKVGAAFSNTDER